MKKLVATLSLAALTTGAFAQGFISIANSTLPIMTQTGTNAPVKTGTAASGYYYDVLFNASTVTTIDSSLQGLAAAGWSDANLVAVNGTGALGAGKITSAAQAVSGWASGTFDSAVVIGWSASLGTTWAQVASAIAGASLSTSGGAVGWTKLGAGEYVGYSTIANANPGSSSGSAAALFGTTASPQVPTTISTGFIMYGAVPEPGTLALAGLGVASLLIFRRRK
jgi:hypothetical protein